jgi:gliding motility-associated protein GldE
VNTDSLQFISPSIAAGLIVLLLICSALVSGSEVAFFSLKPTDLEDLEEDDSSSSANVLKLLKHPDEKVAPRNLLATILVLNNLINVAIVLIATVTAQQLFPVESLPHWLAISIHIAGVTLLIVLFGEVIPKLFATKHNIGVSRFVAGTLLILQKILIPFWKPLVAIGKSLDKQISRPTQDLSSKDLEQALILTDNEDRTTEEKEILERIVKFGDKDAKQVMTPRTDITAFSLDESWPVLRSAVVASGFSRIPIHKGSIDEVVGVLHVKDLIPLLDLDSAVWNALLREPFFIPENMKIDDLLREFQSRKVHMALVVDEYGGTSGLITLEDVLEEIVGDITDEFDAEEIAYSRLDDFTFLMEGKTALIDFYRIMDLDEDVWEELKGESDTLAGFMIEQAGKIPKLKEYIEFNKVILMVDAGDKKKIDRVKIILPNSDSIEKTSLNEGDLDQTEL